jgi:crotonobetainyl-CoA:carnitine CoA-transferase CaiB-like acyl-CoA transferase
MELLTGLRVAQLGRGLAASVCGRLLADLGAELLCVAPRAGTPLREHLDGGKTVLANEGQAVSQADLVVVEGSPRQLRSAGHDVESLRRHNASAPIVLISPFGQNGSRAEQAATDLTLFAASGIARMLTGQVDDLDEAPLRPVGEQSAFIGGIAAACAGMQAVLHPAPGAVIDVSIQEALATLAMTELARAGLGGKGWNRKRESDGNGATVTILPARDGYAAISPREERQWTAWLAAMGNPAWGSEPRFARKADRIANWDALYALMSQWSRGHDKETIARIAQDAHVPSFPLRELHEQLDSAQLRHRSFYRKAAIAGRTVDVPASPFGVTLRPAAAPPRTTSAGPLPLSGIRVLDFSWVIAGPTTTRYLAAMGAEVIKVEAPGQGDPGRATELHTVLGQAKRSIVLDLKKPDAVRVARELATKCDVLVENFATGVMDRLGLGEEALRVLNPGLVYVSASGLGRTGPESAAVAYGTLLQSYAGFAGLNRHPDRPPRIGMAWLDPMCGLMLGFVVAAALWQRRRSGAVARIDFSMVEAMLWTLAAPLLETQLNGPVPPRANASEAFCPHGIFRCAGDDSWLALAVTNDAQWRALCRIVPDLATRAGLTVIERHATRLAIERALSIWLRDRQASDTAARLQAEGIAAAAVASFGDLAASDHLIARGFWQAHDRGALPGLPWRASFGRASGPAPKLGEHTEAVLAEVLGLSPEAIAALRASGAIVAA